MRRIFLAIASVLASVSLMFGVAAAQSTGCSIVNTGPNSNNECTTTDNNNIKVTCTNKADVVFVNNQSANSGSVTLEKNTNGGYAYSGDAVNTNSTTGQLDVSCGAKVASSPAPAPAPTPAPPAATPTSASSSQPAGGQGGGSPAPAPQAQSSGQTQAAVLPNTGSDSAASIATIATSILALTAFGARAAFSSYRRFALK
jgi:hypothetical protein